MKTLLRIGIFVLLIILLLVVISFFLPSKVHVERTAVINADPAIIYKQIDDLHNWNAWMPWNKLDPNMKIDYFGPQEGTGSGYSWTSENKNVGKGKLTISDSKPNEHVVTSMEFNGMGPATGDFKLEKADGGTKVTWGMDSEMGMNPLMKYMGLFMDQMVGGMFEKGLGDLKKISESYTPSAYPEINPSPGDSIQMAKDTSMKPV